MSTVLQSSEIAYNHRQIEDLQIVIGLNYKKCGSCGAVVQYFTKTPTFKIPTSYVTVVYQKWACKAFMIST